ncbi:MAG: SEL1-like repeat protein [Alphaproteobacteria bacterium]|nr:SEL1-like repeat protein [Alphaproteobacteria bacterium]
MNIYRSICLFVLIFFICFSPSIHSSAKDEKKAKKETWLATAFPDIKEGDTTETFMRKVSDMLQNPIINAPHHIGYVDKDGFISKAAQKAYEEEVQKILSQEQKNKFSPYDTNADGAVSLKEIAEKDKVKLEHAEALYKAGKAHRTQAADEIDRIYGAMIKAKDSVHPNSFFSSIVYPFAELDLNGDMTLSSKEIGTPSEANFITITKEIADQFEALMALPNDGKPVSIETVSNKALKTFKFFDKDGSGEISYGEYLNSYYTRVAEINRAARTACKLPDLSDSGPTYAVYMQNTLATASYKFSSLTDYTQFGEVHIEKQSTPINLILISHAGIVWDIQGDTKSLNKIIVFGQSAQGHGGFHTFLERPDPYLQENYHSRRDSKLFPSRYISAAVTGVPKEKVQFSDIHFCLDMEKLNDHGMVTERERAERQRSNEQTVGFAVGMKKPHLLKTQPQVSHVLIKSSPEIIFDSGKVEAQTKQPEGFKKEYWDLFLGAVPQGHKFIDPKDVVSGSAYSINSPYYPLWGGLAQLVNQGILEELKFDPGERKAIFLLKKDLPMFMGATSTNPWNVTLIADKETLHVPYMEQGWAGTHYCVFSRAGDYLHGNEGRCSKSDLGLLHKKPAAQSNSKNIFLRMDKFLPTLTAERESFDIELKIDKKRCEEAYGEAYREKCTIPKALKRKGALDYVLRIEPNRNGTLSWKDENTLTFSLAPETAWDYADSYRLSLDLGNNVLINGKKKGEAFFIPAGPVYEISNLQITPDDLTPESMIITADIAANYDIDQVDNTTVCKLPMGSLTPDAFFIDNSDCEALPTEAPLDDLFFEMKDGRGRIKLVLPAGQYASPPDYLEITGANIPSSTAGGMGLGKALAFFEDPEEKKAYTAKMNNLVTKAQNGDGQAQFELGMAYLKGEEVEKSLYRSRKWLTKAAKNDVQSAWVELGKLILMKIPDKHYYADSHAFYWLTKAANIDIAEAQYQLGMLHGDFQSHFYDGPLSLFWTIKSGEKKFIPALITLGKIYEEGFETEFGRVAKPDHKKSLEYYSAASDLGNMEAASHVARIHYLGLGVDEDITKAYELAKGAILKSARSDLAVRDIAAKIIAEALLRQEDYPQEHDKAKAAIIADRVFNEFPEPYMRMWIAQSMPVLLDTVKQQGLTHDLPVAKAIAERQEKDTPDLAELRLIKALITLNEGLSTKINIFNVYYEKPLMEAIALLEPLVNDPVLDHDAIYVLAECYASIGEHKKIWALSEHAQYQRYFTTPELAKALAWGYEHLGDRQSVMGASNYYQLIGDREGMTRTSFRISGNPDNFLLELKKKVKNNPGQIRPLLEYASFVYYQTGDYENALTALHKALKIDPDNRAARAIAGIAYLAKASQLNKKEGVSENVRKHMNAAKVLGVHKWMVMFSCGLYCKDIAALLDDYYTHIGASENVKTKSRKQDEIRDIESPNDGETPL